MLILSSVSSSSSDGTACSIFSGVGGSLRCVDDNDGSWETLVVGDRGGNAGGPALVGMVAGGPAEVRRPAGGPAEVRNPTGGPAEVG